MSCALCKTKSLRPRCIQGDMSARLATLWVYYIIGSRKWLYIIALLEESRRLPVAAAAVPMWFKTMPALMKFLSDSIIASACLQACFLVLENRRMLEIAKQKGQRSTTFCIAVHVCVCVGQGIWQVEMAEECVAVKQGTFSWLGSSQVLVRTPFYMLWVNEPHELSSECHAEVGRLQPCSVMFSSTLLSLEGKFGLQSRETGTNTHHERTKDNHSE